ncbi:MAG: hypothetical protein KatS3mg087_0096 [Patescibacteria group bacterium]|nr:MAG: hypothetical protein KatS3mg087_0096 [Patescibacteria group bacterium]
MANVWAVKSGNWSDTTVWNTGALPGNGDTVAANGYTVTIDMDLVGSYAPAAIQTSNIGGTAGGGFVIASNRQIGDASHIVEIGGNGSTTTIITIQSGNYDVTFYANVTGGSASYAYGIYNYSTGTVNVTGNVTGGSANYAHGISNYSTGTVNVTGNVTSGAVYTHGVSNNSGNISIYGNVSGGTATGARGVSNISGVVNITGNVVGNISTADYACAVYNSTGTVTINGTVFGASGSWSVINGGSGTVTINGTVAPNATSTSYAVNNISTGTCYINGDVYGGRNAPSVYANNGLIVINGNLKWDEVYSNTAAVASTLNGKIVLNGNIEHRYATTGYYGMTLTSGRVLMRNGANTYTAYAEDDGTGVATGNPVMHYGTSLHTSSMPSESDVRYNVTYGPGGSRVGTCHVPPPQSVLYGVPVDNTTGTATVDAASIAAAVWNAQRSTYSASGTFGAVSEWSGGSLNDVILIGSGTVSSDTNNSPIQFKTNLSGSANKFIGLFLKFSSTANAANEIREIIAFDQATGVVTLNKALTITPNAGDTFYLIGYSGR